MRFLRVQKTYKNNLPTIFLLPTPIGNLSDLSDNVRKYLEEVSVLYCEDTRTTKIILNNFNIKNNTKSFHKYNEIDKSQELLDDVLKYKSIGICSDAGMPGICDPGMSVLNKLLEENNDINLTIISPNCAFLGSLLISGLYYNDFSFIGFLPKKENEIIKIIESNSKNGCLVFYESVHRIIKTISELGKILKKGTLISIVRELTKLNEEVVTGAIEDVNDFLNSEQATLKGEFCIIIQSNYKLKKDDIKIDEDQILTEISQLVENGNKLKDAVKVISEKYNINKNDTYNLYIFRKRG